MRGALEKIGATDIELDSATQTGKFNIPDGMDIEAEINKIKDLASVKMSGWQIID